MPWAHSRLTPQWPKFHKFTCHIGHEDFLAAIFPVNMSCTAMWRSSTKSYIKRLFVVLELKFFLCYFWPKAHPDKISLFIVYHEHRSSRDGTNCVGSSSAIRTSVSATATNKLDVVLTGWHIMCFGGAYPRRNRLRHFCAIYDGSNPTLETNAHDTYEQGKNCLKVSPLSFWKFLIYFSVVAYIVDTLMHECLVRQQKKQCFIMEANGVGVGNCSLTKSLQAPIFKPLHSSHIMICAVCWCYPLAKKHGLPILHKLIWDQSNTADDCSLWLWTRKHLVFDINFSIWKSYWRFSLFFFRTARLRAEQSGDYLVYVTEFIHGNNFVAILRQ